MENGSKPKREMKAAASLENRVSRWWPLITFFSINVISISVILISISRFVKSFFKQKKSVKGKIVLITGTGRGLGRGLALLLSKLGAHIACVDINTKNNEETVKLIKQNGGTAHSFSCNIAKPDQIEVLKKEVSAKMGTVDILVNNAALLMAIKLNDMTDKDIRAMYEVNLMGPVFLSRTYLKDMIKRNDGHIVTISSVAAISSSPFLSIYASTKAGLSRFFDSARVELDARKDNQIKLTTVHPFFVNTSADYASWFNTFFPIGEEDYTVRQILNAILYEKENVTIPAPLALLKVFDSIFGTYQVNCMLNFVGDQIHLPSQKDREELPYTAIVEDTVST